MDQKKVHICVYTGPFNKGGGIERYSVELVRSLIKLGYPVSIITEDVGFSTEGIVRVFKIPSKTFFNSLTLFIKAFLVSGIFFFRVKRQFPDAVFITNGSPMPVCDFYIAQSVHGKAVVLTNQREPYTAKGVIKRLLRLMRPFNVVAITLEWFVVRRGARKVIAISSRVKEQLVSFYGASPRRIAVVHSGVNSDDFIFNDAERKEVRSSYGFANDDFLFLFVGNEFKRKGLRYVLEALSRVRNTKVKLVIVGRAEDGPFKKIAQSFGISNQVFFVGHSLDVKKWYEACDAFILPTLDEAFGLVVIEAMAVGLPVIVSDAYYAGVAELISDGVDGLLLKDPTDVADIKAKMLRIIGDKHLRHVLSFHAQATARKYTYDRVAREILSAR
jgi:UDP-glucose:(heptosyl)LPS alpha-1,3-glucosyltransferase